MKNDKTICYKVRDKIIFSVAQLIQFLEFWVREIHSHNLQFTVPSAF
jgi:hypothetical protein